MAFPIACTFDLRKVIMPGVTITPCLSAQVKYCLPLMAPLLRPFGASRMTPARFFPLKEWEIPVKWYDNRKKEKEIRSESDGGEEIETRNYSKVMEMCKMTLARLFPLQE